jgi:hypothetical protein
MPGISTILTRSVHDAKIYYEARVRDMYSKFECERAYDVNAGNRQSKLENEGDRVVAGYFKRLDNLPYDIKRTVTQIEFHQHIAQTMMPIFYRDEFDKNSQRILQKYAIDDFNSDLILVTPRRFGKSTGTCQHFYAALCEVPYISINIYAHRLHVSEMIVATVCAMFLAANISGYIVKHNHQRAFVVQFTGEPSPRKITAMANTPDVRLAVIVV